MAARGAVWGFVALLSSAALVTAAGCRGDTSTSAPSAVGYTVPSAGGSVDVKGPAGTTYTLTFPASLAGLEVRIAAADAAALTWSSSIAVRDGITMEPAGTALAAPITVKASDPTATLYGVRIDGTTRTGTPLATSAGGFALPTIEAVAAGSGHEDAGVENDADSPVDATSDSTQAMPDASPRCVRVAST